MATFPGLDADIFFGLSELPDWRREKEDRDDTDEDLPLTAEERAALVALLGFDPAEESEEVIEVKDAAGHEHGEAGRFSSTGGRSMGKASSRAQTIVKAAGTLSAGAQAVVGKVKEKIVARYQAMEQRYGRKGAIAVMAATVALTPVPVPGSSFVPVALAEGVLAVHKLIKSKSPTPALVHEGATGDNLSELVAAVREALDEAYQEVGEKPPALTDDEIAQAIQDHLSDEEE
jgi:hypothetical protein